MDEFDKPPRRPDMYATNESASYELRFQSLFHEGRGYAFDCDADGHVDVDALSDRARMTFLTVQSLIGLDYATPAVRLSGQH
jgi:hypothetical protein